jgi:predicted Zn-dependent protease
VRFSASPATFAAAVVLLASCAPAGAPPRPAPAALVDDVAAAERVLEAERERLARGPVSGDRLQQMVRLGIWDEVESRLERTRRRDAAILLAEAELRIRQHRYVHAGELVDAVLRAEPANRAARLLRARLQVQAWLLPQAEATLASLLQARPRDEEATLLLGRIRLLQRRYPEALELAARVQGWNPGSAGAHLLEADTRFWDEDLAGAEPALVRALAADPFDPDARFAYGYAIWRRVDATQLDAMAAQWRLALALDPLHYVTHWHWGNGHTNLTYADYALPSDTLVRERLAHADRLISAGDIAGALGHASAVEREFPESVLPAMLRGSAFYMAYDMDRAVRLDSAETIFRSVLERKRNYGPAHNGLAAVIKQRQFTVLAQFDSLQAEIAATPLTRDPALEAVIPDVRYYPGSRVEQMVRQQLGPSAAYLPLIRRQGRVYRIPPLHHDLAQAMGNSFFRTATTFDNRQWMDIRGVGSGAAGIEYVERGSHQERDVFLHELVHLFHGIVFTDAESRRVRDLYHRAMEEGRTVDYYAGNNEHEFLAQAYPAFLSPVKIHPLNHKAMATHDLLRERDPATYAWIDSLVVRQRAALAGDRDALRSNWAQVYVNLSETARRDRELGADARITRAVVLLDSALVHDAAYLPAMLSYAALERERSRFADAERWLARAAGLDPAYAPLYAARAELAGARARAAGRADGALEERAALLRRSLELERDLAIRAQLNQALRELYRGHGRLPEAIRVAEEYVAGAPTVSTYLRDRRDEAQAFAWDTRVRAGYASESLEFFRALVAQKPQNWSLRAQYVDALVGAARLDEADRVAGEALRLLEVGGTMNLALAARGAEVRLLLGDSAGAWRVLEPALAERYRNQAGDLRAVRVLQALGQTTEAHRQLDAHTAGVSPAARAELAFTRGSLAAWRGDEGGAERLYREAVLLDPYHGRARVELARLLDAAGRRAEARALASGGLTLALPLGPDYRREVAGLLE